MHIDMCLCSFECDAINLAVSRLIHVAEVLGVGVGVGSRCWDGNQVIR